MRPAPGEKKPSVSVHVAGPRGPAGARQSPSRVLIVGFVSATVLKFEHLTLTVSIPRPKQEILPRR